LPGRFVVTWLHVIEYNSLARETSTYQMILYADGRIQFGYADVADASAAIVGLFVNDTAVNTIVDFSATTNLSTRAGETIYETFPRGSFDLIGSFLVFTPNDARGYDVGFLPDTTPPTCTIGRPADGATLTAGSTVQVTADADNNRVPVRRVDFIVNGVTLATDDAAPFNFLFTVPAGVSSLALSAVATNTAGKTGTAPTANVSVVADP